MKIRNLSALLVFLAGPIALLASSGTDRKIEDAAKASYNFRTVLEDRVTAKADDGVVTLTGVVADKDMKSLAEDTVSNLPGVLRVDNQVTFDAALAEHSDAWIALKIHYQLLAHANVSYSGTKIEVKDGVVTLTGTADTIAQKELTAEYAKDIDWVKSVKNDIVVNASPAKSDTMGVTVDDASITTQVKYALFTHKSTSALKTKITTTAGVVDITGVAANEAEKTLVGKLALGIRGVKSVDNNMTVKSEKGLTSTD